MIVCVLMFRVWLLICVVVLLVVFCLCVVSIIWVLVVVSCWVMVSLMFCDVLVIMVVWLVRFSEVIWFVFGCCGGWILLVGSVGSVFVLYVIRMLVKLNFMKLLVVVVLL